MRSTNLLVISLFVGLASVSAYKHGDNVRGARSTRAGESTAAFWNDAAASWLDARRDALSDKRVARNVIMFLGDGMSVPTIAAARALKGQRLGYTGEEQSLSFEDFPTVALSKTYCVNSQIADSACTATAYLCGVKTNQGVLGLTSAVPRYDCEASLNASTHVDSIAAWALQSGKDVGVVTTTRITHASPAGVYAKSATRNWESDANVVASGVDPNLCPDIAYQMVHNYPARDFKVILGGGRYTFIPNTSVDEQGSSGVRLDGRNLIEEWQQRQQQNNLSYAYAWNKEQLAAAVEAAPDRLLGLFASSHLKYQLEHSDDDEEPTIAEMTEAAVKVLESNPNGYFLFVEGGRIDHAHHETKPRLALDETIRMAEAVEVAQSLTDAEHTLIVVTADHAHVMAYNGYSPRGNDILGASSEVDADGVPYMTLSYANGPGFRAHLEGGIRPDVTQEEAYGEIHWRSHVDVPLESETHGGDDVPVFASGPRHAIFSGLYEQSHIPHLMAYAACIGSYADHCDRASSAGTQYASLILIASLVIALFNH